MSLSTADIVVVGAGNAALSAATAALQTGASVTVLECAAEAERGGNTAFTAGAMRVAYRGVEDLRTLMPDLTDGEIESTDFGRYDGSAFYDDLLRVTEYRTDADLAEILVTRSFDTLCWMHSNGIRFQPIFGRQAFKIDGRFRFWGGLTVEAWGGGRQLVDSELCIVQRLGGRVIYQARALSLRRDDSGIRGVVARIAGRTVEIPARAVVLASGGFQANAEWRTRYLGPGWDLAKVRGTRFATGEGIRMALEIGAMPWGNWSGCHAVGWDRNAPPFGDREIGDAFQKHSYPFGIMVNARGRRFVDEGADFRNYTYAKYGQVILQQPRQFAWQVFDGKVLHLLRDEYRIKQVTKVRADTLKSLAERLEGVDEAHFLETVRAYNAAVRQDISFDPNVKDGRSTSGLEIDKSNWANTIDQPPFEAYAVTCGITFTFGGLRIDGKARVQDVDGAAIPGLFAAGELVGGLFYFNYPGGTGLTAGSVFGRIAGTEAARFVVAEAGARA